jgi:hypothetical protein
MQCEEASIRLAASEKPEMCWESPLSRRIAFWKNVPVLAGGLILNQAAKGPSEER